MIGLITLNSCTQEPDVKAMLENSETRSEIIKAISDDHNLMTEFMENMQGNNHAMQMMKGDKKMMGMMMKGGGMQMMMKDRAMMGTMMGMMHKEGMMSKDCMQSGMKMNGKENLNEEDHSSQH